MGATALPHFLRSDWIGLSSPLQVQTPIIERVGRIVGGCETRESVEQFRPHLIVGQALEMAVKNYVTDEFAGTTRRLTRLARPRHRSQSR